jgi:hypothetical protein
VNFHRGFSFSIASQGQHPILHVRRRGQEEKEVRIYRLVPNYIIANFYIIINSEFLGWMCPQFLADPKVFQKTFRILYLELGTDPSQLDSAWVWRRFEQCLATGNKTADCLSHSHQFMI